MDWVEQGDRKVVAAVAVVVGRNWVHSFGSVGASLQRQPNWGRVQVHSAQGEEDRRMDSCGAGAGAGVAGGNDAGEVARTDEEHKDC